MPVTTRGHGHPKTTGVIGIAIRDDDHATMITTAP
jgi:hypothetical protein